MRTTVVVTVPRWRQLGLGRLEQRLALVRANLKEVSTRPSKVVELFGGQLVAQLWLILALGCALHAFGASLSLPGLIIAVTMAGILASVSPAGGGVGVAEAGLIVALTAGGIESRQPRRPCSSRCLFCAYLPPIAGWLTFIWMRKPEYL